MEPQHELNRQQPDRVDKLLRATEIGIVIVATALFVPSSSASPESAELPSSVQASDGINIPPNPTDKALDEGVIKLPSSVLSNGSNSSSLSGEIPAITTPTVPSTPSITTPRATTSKAPTPVAQSKESNTVKLAIESVPASEPTWFIAPEILPYVARVGQVKSVKEGDSWTITPPEDTNAELEMVWWWSEHSKIGTDMTGTGYLYAHSCHEGASIECAGDHFKDLRVGDTIKLPTETGIIELKVTEDPLVLPKTASGIGSSDIYDYNQPGIVYLVTCGYQKSGVSNINYAVKTEVVGATSEKYNPSN